MLQWCKCLNGTVIREIYMETADTSRDIWVMRQMGYVPNPRDEHTIKRFMEETTRVTSDSAAS